MRGHYYWWLGLIVTYDMKFIQWVTFLTLVSLSVHLSPTTILSTIESQIRKEVGSTGKTKKSMGTTIFAQDMATQPLHLDIFLSFLYTYQK